MNYAQKIERYYTKTCAENIFFLDQPTLSEKYSPLYGELFAKKIIELIKKTKIYRLIEFGGGLGSLAKDIQEYIKRNEPQIYEKLKYIIIDFSLPLCKYQKKRLMDYKTFICNGDAICTPLKSNNLEGIIIANEMIADLPFEKSFNSNGKENDWHTYGIEIFIKEIKRILKRGAIIIIEYGKRSKSVLNLLGNNENKHYELGVNFNHLEKEIKKEFDNSIVITLQEFFEADIKTNILYKIIFETIPSSVLLFFKKRIQYNSNKKHSDDEINNKIEKEIYYLNSYTIMRTIRIKRFFKNHIFSDKLNYAILIIILKAFNIYDRWHFGMRLRQRLNNYRDAFACVIIKKDL